MSARNTRLLIAAHSHPAITKGGAEIAAWRLFESITARRGWNAWFMGCAREMGAGRAGSVITQPFSDAEFVYAPTAFDWFKFADLDKQYPRELETVLAEVAPDVVHFHHYVNFGVETFLHIRRALPECRIVLTLHEFQAICNHYGQMVTKRKSASVTRAHRANAADASPSSAVPISSCARLTFRGSSSLSISSSRRANSWPTATCSGACRRRRWPFWRTSPRPPYQRRSLCRAAKTKYCGWGSSGRFRS
jgi:hypothetical protein